MEVTMRSVLLAMTLKILVFLRFSTLPHDPSRSVRKSQRSCLIVHRLDQVFVNKHPNLLIFLRAQNVKRWIFDLAHPFVCLKIDFSFKNKSKYISLTTDFCYPFALRSENQIAFLLNFYLKGFTFQESSGIFSSLRRLGNVASLNEPKRPRGFQLLPFLSSFDSNSTETFAKVYRNEPSVTKISFLFLSTNNDFELQA